MARILLACLTLLAGLPAAGREPLSVFVSVVPQQSFVEALGGDRVRVRAMVLPGQSPHTYEPTPRQVAALADADLYVRIGVPFEDAWMERVRAANPHMTVLDAREGIRLRPGNADDDHEDGDGHGHGHDVDPHLWTSPPLVKAMARRVADQLAALDPEGRASYEEGYAAFAGELDRLDAEVRALLAPVDQRRFLVFHPAWGYFADTYGLVQVPIEREGKTPGARGLAALIDQARREQARVIIVQPQFDRRAAEQVARAIDGRVETVDPLSADYFGQVRRLARLIAGEGAP